MEMLPEELLFRCIGRNDAATVKELLQDHVDLNVNYGEGPWTIFFLACRNGAAECVKELLKKRDLDVNLTLDNLKWTPFWSACYNNRYEVVKMLLSDRRVDINRPSSNSETPLWQVVSNGSLPILQLFLISNRPLDFNLRSTWAGTNVLEEAGRKKNSEILHLLSQFMANPQKVRMDLMIKLKEHVCLAAEVFAIIVMICDDYLVYRRLPNADEKQKNMVKFLSMACRLPIEIQMVLCNRMFDLSSNIIFTKHSQQAFKFIFHLDVK